MFSWTKFFCWIEAHPGLASWLQAFGALIALGIAIGVPWWQKHQAIAQAKAAELEQVRYVLRNLLDEMLVISAGFAETSGKKLNETQLGHPFNFLIPIMDRPFPVFDASAPKLGSIPNDKLRRLIITAYGRANGFVSSVRLNNALVDRLDQAAYLNAIHQDDIHQNLVNIRYQTLVDYAEALKNSYADASNKMAAMKVAIEKELGIR